MSIDRLEEKYCMEQENMWDKIERLIAADWQLITVCHDLIELVSPDNKTKQVFQANGD